MTGLTSRQLKNWRRRVILMLSHPVIRMSISNGACRVLLGSKCILLPSFFAFTYCSCAASFTGLFLGDLEFGHVYWGPANVSILSEVFSARTHSEMTVILGTWSMKEKGDLLQQRRRANSKNLLKRRQNVPSSRAPWIKRNNDDGYDLSAFNSRTKLSAGRRGTTKLHSPT